MPDANLNNQYEKLALREKEAKTVRKIVFITSIAIILILAGAAVGGYYYISDALSPVDPNSDEQVEVNIPAGSSVTEIANTLEDNGIINNATVFRYYIKYKNESGFKAGFYTFSPAMTIDEIIGILKEGGQAALQIPIPEGLWIVDIAEIIAEKTDYKKEDILSKMRDRQYIESTFMDDYPFLKDVILKDNIKYPLEGYLFPATYSFEEKQPPLETIIKTMLGKTAEVLEQVQPQIEQSDFSVHEVMTLASLIEEEGTDPANRRKISSVFYNRLEKDMILQTDPTLKYALQSDEPLTNEAKEVESPFNTYKYEGLPPGPIANPGLNAIQATLNPEETDYVYFFARPNGKVYFTKTYEQHQQVVNKYDDEWQEYFEEQNKE